MLHNCFGSNKLRFSCGYVVHVGAIMTKLKHWEFKSAAQMDECSVVG